MKNRETLLDTVVAKIKTMEGMYICSCAVTSKQKIIITEKS
jgi:hypothetical protein